jgi:prophage regulatory protein|tara:strand:- start:627 stop:842 length:216 start_codon:yes stop_codon:yes gene_type:complete
MDVKTTQKRIVRMKDLPSKIGFQPSTIYGLIAEGKFPAPHKLVPGGRAAGWLESTIDAWIKSGANQNEEMK